MSKDALHQLIHSLSASEKRYYIRSKGESHLTTLFDAVNKLEVYDRAMLEKRLSKHPELLKYFAKYRNDTYTDIIRVMRSYRQEKYPGADIRIKVYLSDIVFLIERGLYENALKLVRDAKKLAMKYEKYEVVLEIIQHEIKLSKRLYRKGYIKITSALLEEKNRIISIINDEHRYTEIGHLMDFAYQRFPGSDGQNRRAYLDELIGDELLTNKKRAISFISQYRYYQIHGLYHDMMGNLEERYKYQKKVLDCWDAHPHQKCENLLFYTGHIFNYLHACVYLKKYTAFEQVLDKAKKEIKPKTPNEEAIVFERLYYPELFYYYNKADFAKLDAIITDMQSMLNKHSKIMAMKEFYTFKAEVACVLFIMGKYEEAYKGWDDIIKQKLPTRIDHQCLAWLFKLAIAYEREDDNFDNLHRAAQRFFQKIDKEENKEAYSLFMEFLHRSKHSALSDTKALYVEYQSMLQKLYFKDKRPTSGLEEILIWMEHIITKQSMMAICKKQVAELEVQM